MSASGTSQTFQDFGPRFRSRVRYWGFLFFSARAAARARRRGKPSPSGFSDADKLPGPPTPVSSCGHRPGGNLPPYHAKIILQFRRAADVQWNGSKSLCRKRASQEPTKAIQTALAFVLLLLLPRCYLEQGEAFHRFQRTV